MTGSVPMSITVQDVREYGAVRVICTASAKTGCATQEQDLHSIALVVAGPSDDTLL